MGVEGARERARASLRRCAPEIADVTLEVLGHGLDNAAFLAEGLVLRVADAGDVSREASLLQVLGSRVSIAVPAPCFVDEEAGVLAYPVLPGRPLLGRTLDPSSAQVLGTFLRELHDIDPVEVADTVPVEDADPAEWLEELEGPSDLLAVLRATAPPPARRRVLAHADLGAEHVLEHDGVLTGVIDWSDAAITDPAVDFARLYRDFGPVFLASVVGAYGGLDDHEATMARITFYARYAALEDLSYGRISRREEYVHAAEQALARLFHRWP